MIYPMFTLIALTILVGFITVKARLKAVKTQELNSQYFALMQGQKPPESIIKTTRCFNNLFELPTLFYAACLLSIIARHDSYVILVLAWLFVIARLLQAYIHLTYNNVKHRMYAFGASVISVTALWVYLVLNNS